MTNATCTIDDCDRPFLARGMCRNHYNQALKKGMKKGSPGHVIRNAVPGAETADCFECGPGVAIAWQRRGTKPTCLVALAAQREYQKRFRASESPERKAKRREYHRQYQLKVSRLYRFGLSEADLLDRLEDVGHACQICSRPIDLRSLRVDHDHACCPTNSSCGECIRGLLCNACNTGIGHFGDDVQRISAAAQYLSRTA